MIWKLFSWLGKLISWSLFLFHVLFYQAFLLTIISLHRDSFFFCLGVHMVNGVFLRRSQVAAIIWTCRLYEGIFKFLSGAVFFFAWIAVGVLLIRGSLNHDSEMQDFAGRLIVVAFYASMYLFMPGAFAEKIREYYTPYSPPYVPSRVPKVMPTRPEFSEQDIAELERKLRRE